MTVEADIGSGMKVEVETAAGSGTYFELEQVTACPPPAVAVDSVETTHMQSGRARTYIPGLRDQGEMEVTMNYQAGSTTDVFIRAWIAAAELRDVKLTDADGEIISGDGFPTGYAPDPPMDDRKTATLNIKASGDWAAS